MREDGSREEIESLRAEVASLKAMVAGLAAMPDSGLDFTMMGSDDAEMPVVPIGGGMENFEPQIDSDGKITIGKGCVCVGRKHYRVEGGAGSGAGEYRLKITLSTNQAEIKVEKGNGFEGPEDEISYIPLYTLSDKGIEEDYRSNFCVVARE